MAEVLSQSEIDALLAAVSSGSVETDEPSPAEPRSGTDWVAYDLTSQEKIVRGRLAALQGIHDRFSRLFRTTLSNALKKNVSVNVLNTDFLRFNDYLGNILLPASINVIRMTNLKGTMLFVMSSKLTYALVDAYYGGSERPYSKIGGREEFTMIENTMIKKICELAVKDMKEAWKINYPIELEYERAESNPHFVGGVHSGEPVAVVSFEVEFENLSGPFVVALQVRALDSIHQHLSVNLTSEITSDSARWKDHWKNELGLIPLEVVVQLGIADRTLRDVSSMAPGDELMLSQESSRPLSLYVEGIEKAEGLMGVCRGNTALRVTGLSEVQKG